MVDEVLNYNLPPSTKLNHEEVVAVINAIAGFNCIDLRRLCTHFLTFQPEPPTTTPTEVPLPDKSFFRWAKKQFDQTIYIGDKEASGRVLLGLFMNILMDLLSLKYPNISLYIDHEYKVLEGRKFYTDEAVVAILHSIMEAIFVFEYKPKVSPNLADQIPFHISETLVQAYYLRKKFRHNILHCLSDLTDFHFFLITTTPDSTFNITKYWYKNCNLLDPAQVTQLTAFLCDTISV